MKFRTEIEREPLQQPIDCRDKVLFVGSCFSDHIGSWLESHWLNVLSNPWGVLFNPASIAQSIQRIQNICKNSADGLKGTIGEKASAPTFELHEQNGTFYSFDHHGKWSGKDSGALLKTLADLDKTVADFYNSAKHVFVTFGTSWVYEREGRIVANCHKFPASEFTRRNLSVEEIADTWSQVIERDNQNRGGSSGGSSGKHWIFTVSPIRHIKDTLHGNQLSKSTLLLAIDELQRRHPKQVEYLNVYELFNDELRDYRFYDSDMVHPSPTGIEAVHELVSECCFTQQLQQYMREAAPIVRALQHKPTDAESAEYKKFVAEALLKKEALLAKYVK